MKILLFLNGPSGSQMGIEDGFKYLKNVGRINELTWFYFDDFSANHSTSQCLRKMKELAEDILPQLIVFFHIGNFPIKKDYVINLKSIQSKPILVYDEGDMYGGWAKPLTSSMKVLIQLSDVVSIRGLGKWYKTVKKYNQNIIYTPHCNSLVRQTKNILPGNVKKNKLVFIGNRVTSRLGWLHRLSGAYGRKRIIREMGKIFPNEFQLYGNGWKGFSGNMDILDFKRQTEICSNSLLQLSYEHYPNIPYYFSDRLPIALACGQIYICHYHKGYENIFKRCDFIYFYKSVKDAIDIINYLFSLDPEELNQKSLRAKEFADQILSPEIVWGNFLLNIEKKTNKNIHLRDSITPAIPLEKVSM